MAGPLGGFGAVGGAAAGGAVGGAATGGAVGAGCVGGATGGGACGGAAAGGGGGGGAGRGGGGGAAAGGAGRAGGAAFGASFGASLGGCFGLPSGPTSSLAWATTSGAVCACEVADASCTAVRAVAARSRIRSLVMMVWVLEGSRCKILDARFWMRRSSSRRLLENSRHDCSSSPTINEQALGWIVAAFKRQFAFIFNHATPRRALVHDAFTRPFFEAAICIIAF
jgi:hypothetical protein